MNPRVPARGHRALALLEGDTFYWFWVGSHDEYERLTQTTAASCEAGKERRGAGRSTSRPVRQLSLVQFDGFAGENLAFGFEAPEVDARRDGAA